MNNVTKLTKAIRLSTKIVARLNDIQTDLIINSYNNYESYKHELKCINKVCSKLTLFMVTVELK